jgi:GGDEF domain-containing protein
VAERLRESVAAKRIEIAQVNLKITASFGGASAIFQNKNMEDMTPEMLINLADAQLYRSKNGGRNRTHVVEFQLP